MNSFASKWLLPDVQRDKSDTSPSGTYGTAIPIAIEPNNGHSDDVDLPSQADECPPKQLAHQSNPVNTPGNASAISAGSPIGEGLKAEWFAWPNPVPVPVHELTIFQLRALARCGKRYLVEPTPIGLLGRREV